MDMAGAASVGYELLKLVETSQIFRLPKLVNHLSRELNKVASERKMLHDIVEFVEESGKALNDAASNSCCGCCKTSQTEQRMGLKDAFERDCSNLSKKAELIIRMDMRLGAQMDSLMSILKPMLHLLESTAARADIEGVLDNDEKDYLIMQTSEESSSETGGLDPALRTHFHSRASESSIGDLLSGVVLRQGECASTRTLFEDQERPLPLSHIAEEQALESRRSQLATELLQAQEATSSSEAECQSLGLDINGARWRNDRTSDQMRRGCTTGSQLRVRHWLHDVDEPTDEQADLEVLEPDAIPPENCVGQQEALESSSNDGIYREEETADAKVYIGPMGTLTKHKIPTHKSLQPKSNGAGSVETGRSYQRFLQGFRRHKRSFYAWGTVFKVSNDSIKSNGTGSDITGVIRGGGRGGAPLEVQTRWFIVIEEGEKSCKCLRITTNEGCGVGHLKDDEKKSDYSVIHTGSRPPRPTVDEEDTRDDSGPMRRSIRIKQVQPDEKLDRMHRLHWKRVYEVVYTVKSVLFGKVHSNCKFDLEYTFKTIHREATVKSGRSPKAIPSNERQPSGDSGEQSLNPLMEPRTGVNPGTLNHTEPVSSGSSNLSPRSKFRPGQLVELTIDRGEMSQERQFRTLLISEVRQVEGIWQYMLRNPKHQGPYSGGQWIDESPWLGLAKS